MNMLETLLTKAMIAEQKYAASQTGKSGVAARGKKAAATRTYRSFKKLAQQTMTDQQILDYVYDFLAKNPHLTVEQNKD